MKYVVGHGEHPEDPKDQEHLGIQHLAGEILVRNANVYMYVLYMHMCIYVCICNTYYVCCIQHMAGEILVRNKVTITSIKITLNQFQYFTATDFHSKIVIFQVQF